MRKIKRMIAIGSIVAIIVTAAGCSSTNESAETTETSTQSSESTQSETTTDSAQVESETKDIANSETATADDSIVYGKVTAIDGSTVTLAVGDMPQGNKMEGGQAPDGQAPSKDDAQNNQQPGADQSKEAPSENKEASTSDTSQENTQAPSGEKPSQQPPSGEGEVPDMNSLFVESGESLTITIEDESLIKIMSGSETTTGSLSDIAVDSILSIQYDDSQNITSIIVTSQTPASE